MFASLLLFVATALSVVKAAPFEKRGLAQVISNCNHDLAYTWDDGPYTAHNDINAAFNRNNGKTTFFMNGDNWSCIYDQNNVDAIRASFAAGHQIASHTWSHAHLPQLTEAQIDVEIQRLDEAFLKIVGVVPKFLRPPYGDIDERTSSYIQQRHGKTIVLWSDDSTDSTGGSTQDSIDFYNRFANENPKRPHMTLSHETEPAGTAAMYAGTVDTLASHGVNLLTVAQCLDTNPYLVTQARSERDSTWYCGGTWNPPTTTSTSTSTRTSTSTSTTTSGTSTSTSTTSTPAPTCVSTYTSQAGDTCSSIETKYGLSSGAILAANSFLNCADIWAFTPICIPPGGSTTTRTTTTPTSTTSQTTSTSSSSSTSGPSPTCVSNYTAVAGDTCAKIENNYELPSGSIQAANPSWLNCSDIWANTPICIPPGGSGCTLKISTVAGDTTCTQIASRYGITVAQLQSWNPSWLNCSDVWVNTPLCVRH